VVEKILLAFVAVVLAAAVAQTAELAVAVAQVAALVVALAAELAVAVAQVAALVVALAAVAQVAALAVGQNYKNLIAVQVEMVLDKVAPRVDRAAEIVDDIY
jgi:hypothetical protein